jgi:hypothetical protein
MINEGRNKYCLNLLLKTGMEKWNAQKKVNSYSLLIHLMASDLYRND